MWMMYTRRHAPERQSGLCPRVGIESIGTLAFRPRDDASALRVPTACIGRAESSGRGASAQRVGGATNGGRTPRGWSPA